MGGENIYIGRQPILNAEQEIYGYELLFRSGLDSTVKVLDGLFATARVMVNTLNNMGVHKIVGTKKGFINMNGDMLKKGLFESLPSEQFFLEFLESTQIDDELLKVTDAMIERGYRFALDDFIMDDAHIQAFMPLIKRVSMIKVDLKLNSPKQVRNKMEFFIDMKVKLLAEKVENMEEFRFYKNIGFDYFQGFFFERPTIIKNQNTDPKKAAIVNIISLIEEDTDIDKVENAFKQYPDLTINLLRFINSAAIFVRNHINSVKQAITLIGYQKLKSWLILLAYAIPGKPHSTNPLFQTASVRGKALELMVHKKHGPEDKNKMDTAFLTGLLSLMDALFMTPIEDILKGLNVSQEIQDSIIHFQGDIGKMLYLLRLVEDNDLETVKPVLADLKMTSAELQDIMLESYAWVEEIKDDTEAE